MKASLSILVALHLLVMGSAAGAATVERLDQKVIADASGASPTTAPDGAVKIGWLRNDVTVTVDGMTLPPAAGLGSWAAFASTPKGAMVMGDTVVFEDEVDAALDAAFAHGLSVSAIHNHFFHDTPKVYFMQMCLLGYQFALVVGVF